MGRLGLFLLLCWLPWLGQASEWVLPIDDERELVVEQYLEPNAAFKVVWIHSQYEELIEAERDFLRQLQAAGIEVWAFDVLASFFLTRTSTEVRHLSGQSVAAVLDAIHQDVSSEKPFFVMSSDRMAPLGLKGIRLWQAMRLGEAHQFKGSIFLFPNFYASTPLAGVAPDWEPSVAELQSPMMILQPEQGVHRWYLGTLLEQLGQHRAPVFSWVLPGVKDYFFAPFGDGLTETEQRMTNLLPAIIKQSAQRLIAVAPLNHPGELVVSDLAGQVARESEVAVAQHALPRLHAFVEPKKAPALSGLTFEGRPLDLESYRGRVVLVNFWATWCPPCVVEIPSMNRLLAKYQAQGLEIVSVDFQETAEVLGDFVEQIPVDYPIMLDPTGKLAKDWGVFSFPTTFVVDREGLIRYSLNQGVEWDIPELEAPLIELLEAH